MSLTNPRWVDVTVEGEETGTQYHGRFQLRPFLKVSEKTDAVLLADKYSKGIQDTNTHRFFLNMLAFLKLHIVSADASWWTNDGQDMLDEAPAYEIANKLKEFQNELKPKKEEKKDEVPA